MSRLSVSDRKSIANLVRAFGPGPIPPRRVEIGVRHGPEARNELVVDYDPGSAIAPADAPPTRGSRAEPPSADRPLAPARSDRTPG